MENIASKTEELQELLAIVSTLTPIEAIRYLTGRFAGKVTFSTSFSYEDQVITHMLADMPVQIFTLDTGRLFKQTYTTWNNTLNNLKVKIAAYYPDAQALQQYITDNGPESFYQSVEMRKACCHIRKVEPLKRALHNNAVWITGLRAAHSPGRDTLEQLEWDATNQIFKYHPLLHWSNEEVKEYIKQYNIPFNILHEQGYVSIGCEPCTRAIKPGEDFRAGRWWWEDNSKKECGLHR
ncbi:MAG: phosphoadenylyl-sulfate reductase [Taibaiella sp.]|nr:phosphoadenylyl-sulfate reductase [Taibaiella sp.]